ncbi:T9SS type A sorting domain-containing protein [Mangrovimonas xylaniphaga]|uniref:T9SS type A sorting domain-containing protein n=1 Tax=Mangrovimonas xylaniphaga TaxID=1645915 RepID=UPI0009E8AEC7|nr:T9SS type A sorting domain-containing protein [Mangrovimonas xylaniphaga]
MKTPTSSNLPKRIVQYSAMAMTLMSSTNVLGQIVYTDIDPDITTPNYNLDLNNDSTDDFQFDISDSLETWVNIQPQNSNAVLGGYGPWYGSPNVLNNGQVISSGQSAWITAGIFMCNGSWGYWCGKTDKYVGLRFKIGLNTHYGWVRLDVNMNTFTIKDYAYNGTPNEPINAGQTTLNVKDFDLKGIKLVSLTNQIQLYNLPEPLDYRVFSITGQIILEGKTEENTFIINTNTFAKGVYIIELLDKQSNSTLKKKIVI